MYGHLLEDVYLIYFNPKWRRSGQYIPVQILKITVFKNMHQALAGYMLSALVRVALPRQFEPSHLIRLRPNGDVVKQVEKHTCSRVDAVLAQPAGAGIGQFVHVAGAQL